jgi:hypothetical protein
VPGIGQSPANRLTEEYADEIREAAREAAAMGAKTIAHLARRMAMNPKTLNSRIDSFNMREEIKRVLRSSPPAAEITGATSEVSFDIAAIRRDAERRFASKRKRARAKARQRISFESGPVALFFVGDQHIGNAGTDIKRMFDEQDAILATPASYVVQMGDVVDNFIIGYLMRENAKPSTPVQEQWRLAQHYLDRWERRLVAVNSGNHDFWTARLSGIDYARDIAPRHALYDADSLRFTVEVGAAKYRVWTRHKWRGSSIYNPTHGAERASRFDASDHDVYVGAHNHTGSVAREFILNGSRKIAIQTGSYKIFDDWAAAEGFPAHDSSTSCALILHEDGSFNAMSNLEAAMNYMSVVYD